MYVNTVVQIQLSTIPNHVLQHESIEGRDTAAFLSRQEGILSYRVSRQEYRTFLDEIDPEYGHVLFKISLDGSNFW